MFNFVVAPARTPLLTLSSSLPTQLFYVQGVLLTPAVVPIAMTVISKRQSRHAAFWGTLFGTACGLFGWLYGCKRIYGEINVSCVDPLCLFLSRSLTVFAQC